MPVWDAVVVGLGGVGSFCLRALARQEQRTGTSHKKILGLEAFVRGHDRGSSHGGTRIYRRAYFEHANYVPWIEYSLQEFKNLEQSSGISLMQECGTLLIEPQLVDPTTSPFDNHQMNNNNKDNTKSKSFLERAWDSAKQHNIPVQFISNKDLKQQFPQFVVDDDVSVGLLEPGGGFVRPEEAMLAALQEAKEQGATLWEQTRITSIREVSTKHRDYAAMMAELEASNSTDEDNDDEGDDSNVGSDATAMDDDTLVQLNVRRADGKEKTILAKTVLVAAGAWTASLIPSLSPYIKVTRQIQAWLDMSDTPDPSLYLPAKMPTWVMISPHVKLPLYGVPADPVGSFTSARQQRQHWIKVGLHGRDVRIDPTQPPPQDPTLEEIQELESAYAHGLANTQHRSSVKAKSCYYSMTPDHHFIIGVPQGYSKVCVVAGLSGHGFKMTPALGQMLADFSRHQGQWNLVEQEWKTQFCSPARFGV